MNLLLVLFLLSVVTITHDLVSCYSNKNLQKCSSYTIVGEGEAHLEKEMEEKVENVVYERGVLSTGLVYEFRGKLVFENFRRENGYNLEKITGYNFIASTPFEIAEAGQFLLFPLTADNGIIYEYVEGRSSILVVNYCLETNNWVLRRKFPEGSFQLGEPNIFSVERITGKVVAHSRNRGSVAIIEGEAGWQRTLDIPPFR